MTQIYEEDIPMDEESLQYYIAEARLRMRQERNAYRHHPDPRDPDWPGHERELKEGRYEME